MLYTVNKSPLMTQNLETCLAMAPEGEPILLYEDGVYGAMDGGRLSIGAMGLGGAQGCFDLAIKYSREREQFGRPISSFQANAFKLADMALEIETARLLLYKACWKRDNNMPFSKEAAMAKLYCSEVMYRCVNHAVQLHGGYGLMKEYDVERFYRDQKLLEIGEGTSEVQRIVIARHIGAL